jgi:hypothetical protein
MVSVLKQDHRTSVFWLSRLPLFLWLLLGPFVILSTKIRDWPKEITWGAWLFLVAISLANMVEGLSLILWGRMTSQRMWLVIGAVWICLGLVVLSYIIASNQTALSPWNLLSA